MAEIKNAERIQTSILNGVERKALIWMGERLPKWVTSDMLTFFGCFGAMVVAAGYILTNKSINFLWLASLGFVLNWFGDSLDGTVARVRHEQRPIYGYYIDHSIDAVNEVMMFLGVGLSSLMNIGVAVAILIVYLLLTLNVSMNSYLKGEFKLTYAKLGPTEFRIIAIIINTLFIFITPMREFSSEISVCGHDVVLKSLDVAGLVIFAALLVIYIVTVISDAKKYAKMDPVKKTPSSND